MDKQCASCNWNDDGLCDRIGIFVNDEDTCQKWEKEKSITD